MARLIIRQGVFETNSSSMHSICIRGDQPDRYTLEQLNENRKSYRSSGIIDLTYDDMEFGRYPFQMLASLFDKCRYALASYGVEKAKEIEDIYKEAMCDAELDKYEYPFTHFKFDPDDASIDHQSAGLLQKFLALKGITLKEFLLNPNYYVVIDGDEYWEFDKYLRLKLIEKPKEVYR